MAWTSPGGACGRVVLDWIPDKFSYPVLSDPATLGCLLHIVREAWGQPSLGCHKLFDSSWVVTHCSPTIGGSSEAAALIAALAQKN